MRAISARICTRSFASRFESGSSMRKTCGSRTIARPIATRWRWPPESARGLRSSSSVEPEHARDLLDACAGSRFCGILRIRRPKPMFSPRSCAGRARSSGRPSRCRACCGQHVVDDRVADADLPSVMSSSPATIRSAVVLPQPDGPTRTTNSPSATSRSRPSDGPGAVRVDLADALEGHRCHRSPSPAWPAAAAVSSPSRGTPMCSSSSRSRPSRSPDRIAASSSRCSSTTADRSRSRS